MKLWNRSVPEISCARPLLVHELDDHAFGSVYFDRDGLIIAERDGRPVGFVHAGFGADEPTTERPFAAAFGMGVVAVLAVEPGPDAAAVAESLIIEAERYLRSRGAKVLYGGGQFPLNPYYWGLYGGAEASGVPSSHVLFSTALCALGYEPVSTTVHLHYDLGREEPRDPRRRPAPPPGGRRFQRRPGADGLVGEHRPQRLSFDPRSARFACRRRRDRPRPHLGHVLVRPGRRPFPDRRLRRRGGPLQRGQGYGRFLVAEILRRAREYDYDSAEVQTLADNEPALALYQSFGFQPVEQSTVFRLPAPFPDRSRPG